MAKRKLTGGISSASLPVFVRDTSSTTGGGLASLVFNTSGLTAEYRRQGQSSWTPITLVGAAGGKVLGTWTSGGFIADGSLAGAYEFDPPNAALLTGVKAVYFRLYGAANMLPVLIEIELDAVDYQSATAFVTGINSLAPPTNWNLDSIDSSGRRDIGKILGTASAGTAGYMAPDWGHVNAPTTTVNLSGTTVGTATTLTNAPSDTSGTTTLLARLTSARAGYLDTLNGIVAAVWAAVADSSGVTTLLARLTGTRAGYLDNLSAAPPTLAAIRADLERNGGSLYNAGAAATAAANDAATIIDLIGAPAGVSIAADIAAIDTGGGGASADELVTAMADAGFAKAGDVRFDGIFLGQP